MEKYTLNRDKLYQISNMLWRIMFYAFIEKLLNVIMCKNGNLFPKIYMRKKKQNIVSLMIVRIKCRSQQGFT